MKKNHFLLLIIAMALCLCACDGNTSAETTNPVETNQSAGTADVIEDDILTIDYGLFVNAVTGGKPTIIVSAKCDGSSKSILSIDMQDMPPGRVEYTLDISIDDDLFYVMMGGNVIRHTLEGDGALYDGIAYIDKNGSANFSVTYAYPDGEERTVQFVININKR